MSALTEKVARAIAACDPYADAPDAMHREMADVAVAATRAAVAAEIKARVRDGDLLGTYEASVNHGLHDAARIAEGKHP